MTIKTRFILFFAAGMTVMFMVCFVPFALGLFEIGKIDFRLHWVMGAGISFALLLIVAMVIRQLVAQFQGPVSALIAGVTEISKGNLKARLPKAAPGEFDVIKAALEQICDFNNEMHTQLDLLLSRLGETVEGAVETFDEISRLGGAQETTAAKTADSVGRLSQDLLQADQGIGLLTQRVEESASTISQMEIATQRVADAVKGIASNIDKASTLIESGDQDAGGLAGDISDLSLSIPDAQRALAGMMDSVHAARADAHLSSEIMSHLEAETGRIGAAIEAVLEGSDAVHLSNERILEVTANLESRVARMDSVIDVIRNVAERTRLLSVNASIMASEAGEHGRAFTVVAREIKDLAQSTSSAISEISKVVAGLKEDFALTIETIKWGQKDVHRGIGLARDAVVLLQSIPSKVHEASDLNSEIARRTETQVENGKHVDLTISKLIVVLQQVEQLFEAQTARNLGTLEAFRNIRLSADQMIASARKQALSSSELNQRVEGISDQLRSLAGSVKKHASDSSRMVELLDDVLAAADSSGARGRDLVGTLEDLDRLAKSLRKDFSKLKGARR